MNAIGHLSTTWWVWYGYTVRSMLLAGVAVVVLATAPSAFAADCVSNASGNWDTPGTWTCTDLEDVPDGDDLASIVSPHTVSVDTAQTVLALSLQSGGTLSFTANNPTVTASAQFGATGGTITGNGTVDSDGSFSMTGAGTFTITNGADVVLDSGGSITDGAISIDGDPGDSSLQVAGGTLTIGQNADSTPIGGGAGATMPTLRIGAAGALVDQQTGNTLIQSTHDNDGEIRAEAGQLTLQNGTQGETSNGDYEAAEFATLTLGSGGATLGDGAALEGAGTILLDNGTMALDGTADITPATLRLVSSTLFIDGTGQYAPGALDVISGAVDSTRDGSATTFNAESATITGDHAFGVTATFTKQSGSQLAIRDGARVTLHGTSTHNGGTVCLEETGTNGDPALEIRNTYTLPAAVGTPFTCDQGADVAHLIIGPGGSMNLPAAGATQIVTRTRVAGGTIAPPADETYVFDNELDVSSGSVVVAPGGSISADAVLVTGGTVDVDGELTLGSDQLVNNGGLVTGTGEIEGSVVNLGGTIAPGASPGTLTIDGPFAMGGAGILAVEVDGDGAGQFDLLEVTGTAQLAGTVALDVGYTPANDDIIQFLTSAGRTGEFGPPTGAGLSGARTFSLAYPSGAPFGARLVVTLPDPPTAGAASVGGTPEPGQTLTCDPGSWGNSPDFAFAWLRDGRPIDGATQQTYVVTEEDRGHELACRVTGTNAAGSAEATSAAVAVPAPPAPPSGPPAGPPQGPSTPTPTAQENRLAAASASRVAQALGFPRRACLSRRRFTIRLREPRGVRLESATITVAGKRVRARRRANGRLTAVVDLRGLDPGRYTVRIVARTVSGKTLRGTRRYRTCTLRGPSSRIPKL